MVAVGEVLSQKQTAKVFGDDEASGMEALHVFLRTYVCLIQWIRGQYTADSGHRYAIPQRK